MSSVPSAGRAQGQRHRSIVYSPVPQDYRLIVVLIVLVVALIVAAHVSRVAPFASRQWRWVWMTLVFLFWLLAGFRSLRA